MDAILIGKAFNDELTQAKHLARGYVFDNLRFFNVVNEGNVTRLELFGGYFQWIIDRDKKRLSELFPVPAALKNPPRWLKPKKADPILDCLFQSDVAENTSFNLLINTKLSGTSNKFRSFVFLALKIVMEKHMRSKGMLFESECNVDALEAMKVIGDGTITRETLRYHEKKLNKGIVMTLNTCWGKSISWDKVMGILGKKLWEHLDIDVAKLAIRAKGRHATAAEYNLIWKYKDEAVKVFNHSPSLIPLWVVACQKYPAAEVCPAALKGSGEKIIGAVPNKISPDNIVATVQQWLDLNQKEDRKLTKSAWRYLLKLKPLWIECLIRMIEIQRNRDRGDVRGIENGITTITDYLNLYAEVGELPSFTFFVKSLRSTFGATHTPSLVGFLRAAFKQSKKRPIKRFYNDQFSLAWDWWHQNEYHGCAGRQLDHNQIRANWAWFMQEQKEWHVAVLANAKLGIHNTLWTSLIEQYDYPSSEGIFTVVPLVSSHDLYDEGQVMHHCVGGGSYAKKCERGMTRIFSIRKGEQHIGTLEITKASRTVQDSVINSVTDDKIGTENRPVEFYWTINQLRAPWNKEVTGAAKGAAQHTLLLYNDAWDKATIEQKLAHGKEADEAIEADFDFAPMEGVGHPRWDRMLQEAIPVRQMEEVAH